jgi:stage II sporulation protein GA (sporulation sigma-E factor processing peptidase)
MGTEYRYLDIIWLDNLIMNFIILWVTLKLSKSRDSIWRLWLSAAIGAFYAVFLFIPGFVVLQKFPLKIALSLVMLIIAFKLRTFKNFFKLLGIFYVVTFVFGGAALGLYYFTNDAIGIENGAFVIKNYPIKNLVMACIFIIIIFRGIWMLVRVRISQAELLYKVEIQFDAKKVILEALMDTGNTLIDPISQCPVLVVEFLEVKDALPPEIQAIFSQFLEHNLEVVTQIMVNSSWIGRFRMIPFTSLGKPNGMLIGFKPDSVRVLVHGNWRQIGNIIVGIYNNKLTKARHYQALIHPEIVA